MIDITPIIGAFITLIGAIITAVVIPYIRARTTSVQQQQIQMWVNVAVAAAEQLIQGDKKGSERKAYVLSFLRERGIDCDTDAILLMIESAVFAIKANNE